MFRKSQQRLPHKQLLHLRRQPFRHLTQPLWQLHRQHRFQHRQQHVKPPWPPLLLLLRKPLQQK